MLDFLNDSENNQRKTFENAVKQLGWKSRLTGCLNRLAEITTYTLSHLIKSMTCRVDKARAYPPKLLINLR